MSGRTISIVMTLLLFGGCELIGPDAGDSASTTLSAAEKQAVTASNRFGLDLLRAASALEPDSNTVVAPFSASMALGMTLNGAAATTYDAMRATLGLEGLSDKEINESYRDLLDLLGDVDPAVVFEIANAIWYRMGFEVRPEFLEANRVYFDATVAETEFRNPETPDAINAWISDETHERISRVVEQVKPTDVMFLVNAIYFNGTWTYRFDPQQTYDAAFTRADGSTATVRMMELDAGIPAMRGDGFRAASLPYGNERYEMTILLPDVGRSVDDLVGSLDGARWEAVLAGLESAELKVRLPRFEIRSGGSIKEALRSLGMGVAFGGEADFTRIEPLGALFIEDVLHHTYVKVNEEGTEASGVTVVVIGRLSGGDDKLFEVNRPFVFVIHERRSGAILFAAKVTSL